MPALSDIIGLIGFTLFVTGLAYFDWRIACIIVGLALLLIAYVASIREMRNGLLSKNHGDAGTEPDGEGGGD